MSADDVVEMFHCQGAGMIERNNKSAARPRPVTAPAFTITGTSQGGGSIRYRFRTESGATPALTAEQSAILQSFPAGYPFQGRTRASIKLQIGNAIPPLLAAALIREVTK